jgi:hypothetical protein
LHILKLNLYLIHHTSHFDKRGFEFFPAVFLQENFGNVLKLDHHKLSLSGFVLKLENAKDSHAMDLMINNGEFLEWLDDFRMKGTINCNYIPINRYNVVFQFIDVPSQDFLQSRPFEYMDSNGISSIFSKKPTRKNPNIRVRVSQNEKKLVNIDIQPFLATLDLGLFDRLEEYQATENEESNDSKTISKASLAFHAAFARLIVLVPNMDDLNNSKYLLSRLQNRIRNEFLVFDINSVRMENEKEFCLSFGSIDFFLLRQLETLQLEKSFSIKGNEPATLRHTFYNQKSHIQTFPVISTPISEIHKFISSLLKCQTVFRLNIPIIEGRISKSLFDSWQLLLNDLTLWKPAKTSKMTQDNEEETLTMESSLFSFSVFISQLKLEIYSDNSPIFVLLFNNSRIFGHISDNSYYVLENETFQLQDKLGVVLERTIPGYQYIDWNERQKMLISVITISDHEKIKEIDFSCLFECVTWNYSGSLSWFKDLLNFFGTEPNAMVYPKRNIRYTKLFIQSETISLVYDECDTVIVTSGSVTSNIVPDSISSVVTILFNHSNLLLLNSAFEEKESRSSDSVTVFWNLKGYRNAVTFDKLLFSIQKTPLSTIEITSSGIDFFTTTYTFQKLLQVFSTFFAADEPVAEGVATSSPKDIVVDVDEDTFKIKEEKKNSKEFNNQDANFNLVEDFYSDDSKQKDSAIIEKEWKDIKVKKTEENIQTNEEDFIRVYDSVCPSDNFYTVSSNVENDFQKSTVYPPPLFKMIIEVEKISWNLISLNEQFNVEFENEYGIVYNDENEYIHKDTVQVLVSSLSVEYDEFPNDQLYSSKLSVEVKDFEIIDK